MIGIVETNSVNLTSNNMGATMAAIDATAKFDLLISKMDRKDINDILSNWNESELNEDGSEILIYVDSRAYGPRTGGADKVDKSECIEWLLSNSPFDTTVYGKEILEDKEWAELIGKARRFIQPAK
jgi:hypothetical protein